MSECIKVNIHLEVFRLLVHLLLQLLYLTCSCLLRVLQLFGDPRHHLCSVCIFGLQRCVCLLELAGLLQQLIVALLQLRLSSLLLLFQGGHLVRDLCQLLPSARKSRLQLKHLQVCKRRTV